MKNKNIVYLAGLNGIRAIAAISVVVSHITLNLPEFNLFGNPFGTDRLGVRAGYRMADDGVSMFFVLSGFLITYLLCIEQDKQSIDLKKFYMRRLLRIWPLYYLYFALVILTITILGIYYNKVLIPFYLFFIANVSMAFLGQYLPILYHFWSLCVEEQFYLVWPLIMKKIKKRILPLIISLIAIQFILRLMLFYFDRHSPLASFSLMARFDCMLIGAGGAILFKRRNTAFLKIVDRKIAQIIALILLGLFILNFHTHPVIDNFAISFVTLVIIVGQICKTNRIISLDNPLFDYLGKISFGIYVYHPFVILILSKLFIRIPGQNILKYGMVYITIILVTVLISHLSYNYFERFFIRKKSKYTIVKSSGFKPPDPELITVE